MLEPVKSVILVISCYYAVNETGKIFRRNHESFLLFCLKRGPVWKDCSGEIRVLPYLNRVTERFRNEHTRKAMILVVEHGNFFFRSKIDGKEHIAEL